jgi:hypothetical protein
MTTTSPIAGNQYFGAISSLTGQFPRINTAVGKHGRVQANTTSSAGFMVTGGAASLNGKTLQSVSGYAPVGVAASHQYYINKLRGQADQGSAQATNTTILTLPPGAIIVGVLLEDATLTGTLSCGTHTVAGTAPGDNTNLVTTAAAANVNIGAIAGLTATVALGGTPLSVTDGAVTVPAAPTVTGVTLSYGAGFGATSGTAVIIYYLA